MNLFFKPNFNTAAALAIAALCASMNAQAQSNPNEAACDALSLKSIDALLPLSKANNAWFVANDARNAESTYAQQTLPLQSANERTLLSQGSKILSSLPQAWDLAIEQNQYFWIVRSKVIRTSPYRAPLGLLVKTIGTARANPVVMDAPSGAHNAALTITESVEEVTANDRLLPVSCWRSTINAMNATTKPAVETTPAPTVSMNVVAFLDETYIAEKNAYIITNQGKKAGVAVGQTWLLIDELPRQPASAQDFGRAQVVQAFDDLSILQVRHAEHEVRINMILRHHE